MQFLTIKGSIDSNGLRVLTKSLKMRAVPIGPLL